MFMIKCAHEVNYFELFIDDAFSPSYPLENGIPQCGVLSPILLFLIMVHDLD